MIVSSISSREYQKLLSGKRKDNEHHEQVILFEWAKTMSFKHPELDLLFAIPNGGARNIVIASKLKKEGVKSGVPDIFLPVAKQNKYGLFIEMKYGKNKPSNNQKIWLSKLKEKGYRTEVCYGSDEAIVLIKEYLGIENE